MKRSLPVFLVCAVVGCTIGRASDVPGYDERWDELSMDEQKDYMAEVIEPRMQAAFREHDAERFEDFGCATCHGQGARDGSWSMPNPDLPHLDESLFFREHRKAMPEITDFMWKGVTKPMGELLGQTVGHRGEFYCGSCHVLVED